VRYIGAGAEHVADAIGNSNDDDDDEEEEKEQEKRLSARALQPFPLALHLPLSTERLLDLRLSGK
jgi:hypothetical protein